MLWVHLHEMKGPQEVRNSVVGREMVVHNYQVPCDQRDDHRDPEVVAEPAVFRRGRTHGAAAESDEEDKESDEEDDDEDEDNDKEPAMPAKKKKSAAKGKVPRKSASAALGGLPADMGNLRVQDASEVKLYSFDWKKPVMKKDYVKNNVNKFKIEFLVHPMGADHFRCILSECGKAVAFYHGTPKLFREERRMKAQMGRNYKKNDPWDQGHNNCVQLIRKYKKKSNGVFWGDPQMEKLSVKVEPPPTKQHSLMKLEDVKGHDQYWMVLSYVYKVVKVRVKKEKEAKVVVCDGLSSDSEGSDIGEDGDHFDGGSSMAGVTIEPSL